MRHYASLMYVLRYIVLYCWDSSVGRAADLHVRDPGFNTHSQLNLARVDSAFDPFMGM